MKTQKSIAIVLVSLLTVAGGALIAQQGGMGGMQGFQMPSEEEMKEMMKAETEESMKEYDDDEDGSLSLDEFTKMVDEAEAEMAQAAEMMPAIKKLGAPEGETEEEKAERMKKMFEGADGDDDDLMSLDETVDFQYDIAQKMMKLMMGEDISEEEEEEDSDDEESEDEDEEEEG
ncbi:MAG: hypothetical protein F4W92_05890 [Gammaproteobacteria bacterium]|nr:hypothetical protein [Gammaproteobacteria bacterium]